jgi:hypothetical protein
MEIGIPSTDTVPNRTQHSNLNENAYSNHSSRSATPILPFSNNKNDSAVNTNIKTPSISPPLLLFNNNDKDEESSNTQLALTDSTQPQTQMDQSAKNKFAMIEAKDEAELNSIIDFVKSKYPHVNIHLCTNPSSNSKPISNMIKNSNDHNNNKNSNKINIQRDNNLSTVTNNYKNCLTANYLYDCHRRLSSERTTSVERQESRDSGFWSMKSLSLSDSHYTDHALTGKQPQHVAATNVANQDRSSQDLNANKNVSSNELPSRSPQVSINTSDVTVNSLNPSTYCWKKWKKGQVWRYNSSLSELENLSISNSQSTNKTENESKHSFENNDSNSYDSSQMLHFTQHQSYNEREQQPNNTQQHFNDAKPLTNSSQAFNFPSGLNLSENENTKLTRSTTQLADYANVSTGFEMSTLSPLRSIAEQTLKASSSIMWSSTSILDKLNTSNVNCNVFKDEKLNLKGNKRRGKLTRDITIDKDDENSFNNGSNSLKNVINNEKSMIDLQSNTSTTENSLIKHELRLLNPSSSKSLSLQYRSASSHQNGRISPPEKRVSLSFEENSDKNVDPISNEWTKYDGSAQRGDSGYKKTLDRTQMSIDEGDGHVTATPKPANITSNVHAPTLFNNQQQQQSKNFNSYLTRLLTQNYFVNDDILKQYKNNIPSSLRHTYQQQQLNSNKTVFNSNGLDSSTSPSTSPSPSSYASLSPLSNKTSILATTKQVNNSMSPDMMATAFATVTAAHLVNNNSSNNSNTNSFNIKSNEASVNTSTSPNSTLNSHYEFYKDLQSKLIIRANSENEETACSAMSVENKNHSSLTIDKKYKSPINYSSTMTTSYNFKPNNTNSFLTSQQTKQMCRSSSSPSYSSAPDQQFHGGEFASHSPSSALSLSNNNNQTSMPNQINMNSQHTSAISNPSSSFLNQTSIFNQINPSYNKSVSSFNIYENNNNSKGNSNFQKSNDSFFHKSSSLSNHSLNNEDDPTSTLINETNNNEQIKNLKEPVKQQMKNNLKPPEIVITETKPDTNEQQVISYQMRNVNFDFNSKRL